MKKRCFLFVACLLSLLVYTNAQSQKATVYLLRPDGPDLYVPYYTYLNQTLLCKLGRGKYSVHEVEPGRHKLHAQYRGKVQSTPETELEVTMEPGKSYYIAVNIETKAFGKGRFYCTLLSEEIGKNRVQVFTQDTKCQ